MQDDHYTRSTRSRDGQLTDLHAVRDGADTKSADDDQPELFTNAAESDDAN